jgi:outer membrane receptor protein involved in Fe transport
MFISRKAWLLAAVAVLPTTAIAQTAPTAADDAGPLEEIVVTARKTSERLSDAPVSVSALSSNKIEELGLNSIDDFAKQATGISFSQAFGRSTDRPVIRGQSNVLAGVQAGVETGAAYFIDGVYYQGDIQGFDPSSIERVEIIKGPQSALYGRNTYAGAINYITKDPTDEFTGSVRATAAEYSEYQIAGSVAGPIAGEKLGFRAGGRYYTYGGQYTNQLTGKKVGDEQTTSGYLTLSFKPSDDFKMRSRVSYQHDKDGPLAIFLQGAADNNCYTGFRSANFRTRSSALPFAPNTLVSSNTNQYYCGVIQPQPNNVRLNTDPIAITIPAGTFIPASFNTAAISGNFDGTAFDGVENKQWLYSNIADWDIAGSGWVISSLTGYRKNKNYFGTDSDHSDGFAYFNTNPAIGGSIPNPLVTEPVFANTNKDNQTDFSQEVRIASPTDGPFRVLAGGYYFKQKFQTVDITFASGKEGTALGTDSSQYATIENKAAFGLLGWNITQALSITGEIRYQEEIKTLIDRAAGTTAASGVFCAGEAGRVSQFNVGLSTATTTSCRTAGKFTGTDPRITIDYKTPGGALIYGVYATGRKPGGFNGTAGVTAEAQFPGQQFVNYLPEKSKGGEIGIKFDALDRRLRMSIAAFSNKLSEVQLTTSIPNPNGTGALTSIVTNSGNAKSQGIEIEAQAAPTEGLTINLGFSYTDAKFTKGCDADYFILNSGGLRVNFDTRNPTAAGLALCDIKGKRLPLGSPYIANGSANYEWGIGQDGDLKAFTVANFSFESSKYVQTDNFAETGDAFLLNARIGVKNERFSIAFFGRNLTNEDSIPLATRWFDIRYGAGTRNLPTGTQTFDGRTAIIETGTPRGFFATLRKGRTFGVEGSFNF